MKTYMLLRNNIESGPYTKEDLAAMGLHPLDLIWMEGISTSWQYASEIDVLAAYIKKEKRNYNLPLKIRTYTSSHQAGNEEHVVQKALYQGYNSLHNLPLKERESKEPEKRVWKRPVRKVPALFNMAAMCIGLALGAFVIKKLVDTTEKEPTDSEQLVMKEFVQDKSNHTMLTGQTIRYRKSELHN